MYAHFVILVQSKYIKISKQKISSIGRNVWYLFCVPLCTDCLSDLYKEFERESTFATQTECQIRSFGCNFF